MNAKAAGHVVVLHRSPRRGPSNHESVTLETLARRVAALLEYEYAGEHAPDSRYPGRVFFVPADMVLTDRARALGIDDERDLLGGVVPHAFMTTKVITHPVVDAAAVAPAGWSLQLAELLHGAVLPGYCAFSRNDARRAGERLLAHGAVRVKRATGIGGSGQTAVADPGELDTVLQAIGESELSQHGVVIEQNLDDPVTYSVGQLQVADMRIAYHGTQQLTRNHREHQVYGGSDLVVVRGSFADLLDLELPSQIRLAVDQAVRYDAAVAAQYPGFFASRRNYDVAQGRDSAGQWRSGVLESSWRIGGASPAEISALEAFRDHAGATRVHAACHEVYADAEPPPQANVHFRGLDENVGLLTKYSLVQVVTASVTPNSARIEPRTVD